uniref:de novo protein with intramolecular isopeptide bond dnIPB-1 n=1 Tax=synthetic construct TaxID=32630 RepID=UPI003BEF4C96
SAGGTGEPKVYAPVTTGADGKLSLSVGGYKKTFTKVDAATKAPLAGAVFQVVEKDGDITLYELSSPAGYVPVTNKPIYNISTGEAFDSAAASVVKEDGQYYITNTAALAAA